MYVSRTERSLSAVAAMIIVAALGLMVVLGLRVDLRQPVSETLLSVTFSPERKPPPPPPPREVRKARTSAAKDAPSPRNMKNKATPVVALPVPIIIPPLVVTAPLAGPGSAANTGASLLPGPGQGAGGQGEGRGGGGDGGYGDGDGSGEERAVVGPRRISGKLAMSDLPEGMLPPGVEAAVRVLFRVRPDGRVSDCEVDGSSGIAALDQLACRLIEQRFRFRPARNRAGRPVSSRVMETHSWYAEPEPFVPKR